MRYGELTGVIKPSVPCIEIGGAVCNGGYLIRNQWTQLEWNIDYFNTSDFEYREDSANFIGKIHVYTTGLYLIDFEIALMDIDECSTAITAIYVNDIAVFGSYSTGYFCHLQQINSSKLVYLKANDEVDFRVWVDGNSVTIADYYDDIPANNIYYSRARITYIPTGGWNNNSGSKVVERGIKR